MSLDATVFDANGRPGIHHVFARTLKDLVCRYQTMRGRHVARKAGWDTHGLPVEIEVEKRLGFSGKQEIEEYGIAEFNRACLESVTRGLNLTIDEGLAVEASQFARMVPTRDIREGIRAFMERRAPQFDGA